MMVHCYTCFPLVFDVSRVFEVVIGGTRLESVFFLVGLTWCPVFVVSCGVHSSGRVWCILSCVWLSGCCLCGHLGWGDRLSTPQVLRLLLHVPRLLRRKRDCTPALFLTSSVCSPAISLRSSEEEGLAPLPSSSQCRGVLRRRRDRPSSSQIWRVHRRGRVGPSSSQCRYVRRLLVGCAVQVVRGQDRAGLLTVGTLRRYHQSGSGYVLHTGAGQDRSGRFATMQRMYGAVVP